MRKVMWPHLGKLVHQLPWVVTFAYNLCFRHMIAHWKYLSKDYNSCTNNIPQKTSFRASKRLRKFKTRKTVKNSKLSKLLESCFEPAGKGGWTPISTYINPPSLGINGIHFIEFLGERGNCLLKYNLGELLGLLEKLCFFAC